MHNTRPVSFGDNMRISHQCLIYNSLVERQMSMRAACVSAAGYLWLHLKTVKSIIVIMI